MQCKAEANYSNKGFALDADAYPTLIAGFTFCEDTKHLRNTFTKRCNVQGHMHSLFVSDYEARMMQIVHLRELIFGVDAIRFSMRIGVGRKVSRQKTTNAN